MPFQCIVITPEQQVLDASARQVILPAQDGLMGVCTDRSPMLVQLGAGPLRVDGVEGASRTFFVAGGIAEMKENHLTVLTDEAVPTAALDASSAAAELAAAQAVKTTDDKSFADAQRRVDAARAKQRLAAHP